MQEQDEGLPGGLDPRSLLVCASIFSIVAACLNNLAAATSALAISACLLPLAWKNRLHLARRLFAANLFILFLWLVTPFSTPGETIWQWGFLNCTRSGLNLALLVTIKANALALVFLSLVAPIPLSAMGSALRSLHCPDKLTWIFLLMGRNIHILRQEWTKLRSAARLRCFRPGNNLHTYRTIGSLLGLLLVRACERSRILHEAMLLRGYNGSLPFCDKLLFRPRDCLFWLCCASSIFLLILLEFGMRNVRL